MSQETQAKRHRRGDPSSVDDGLFFIGYRPSGTEWWGTVDRLKQERETARRSSQSYRKKPEHKSKLLALSRKNNQSQRRKQWRKAWAKKPETIARVEAKKKDPVCAAIKREKNRVDQASRRKSDINFRLAGNIRVRMRSALDYCGAKKAANTEALIGCSIEAFRLHVEANFKPGMTWDKRDEWHLDHALPLSMFDLTDPAQQKIAFHYKNCVPEWKHDNLSKNDSIPGELLRGRHYRLRKIIPFTKAA